MLELLPKPDVLSEEQYCEQFANSPTLVRMLNDKKGAVRTWQEGLASSWTAACGRRGDFRRVAPLKGMLVST